MLTKQEILADATVRFTELNELLVGGGLPPFPIETAYVNLDDDLNGEDAIVTKWFNETIRRHEEMVNAELKPGDPQFMDKLVTAKLRLMFIENICELHTKLVKLMINADLMERKLH